MSAFIGWKEVILVRKTTCLPDGGAIFPDGGKAYPDGGELYPDGGGLDGGTQIWTAAGLAQRRFLVGVSAPFLLETF